MSAEAVHKLAGVLIVLFVVASLVKESGRLRGTWPDYLLPIGVLGLGLFLVLDPIVFHGGGFGAEGLQHQIQGALLLGVAGIELARARGTLQHRSFAAVLPIAIMVVGLLFVVHSQHGGGDMVTQLVQHRILGATVILAAVVKAADSLKLAKGNWASVGWLLLLLAVTFQLFLYVEGANAGGVHEQASAASAAAHGSHGGH